MEFIKFIQLAAVKVCYIFIAGASWDSTKTECSSLSNDVTFQDSAMVKGSGQSDRIPHTMSKTMMNTLVLHSKQLVTTAVLFPLNKESSFATFG